jgi:integrase
VARACTGTISQRGENRSRLQVTPEPDPLTGPRRRLSETIIGTRRDADRALQHLIDKAGARLASETNTVATLLDAFMNTATLAATTRADWQSLLDRHVIDDIGTIPLNRLRARDCDEFYARLRAIGLGPSRVRCAHVVLHRAVAQAVRWGWLTHNVVTAATRPEVPRVNIRPPDAAQVRAAVTYFETNHRTFACWLHVALATGARRGEVCALRWSDIDLDARTVRIERSVAVMKGTGVSFKTTKTGNVRLVTLTTQAIEALREHRAHVEANRGARVGTDEQIFTDDPTGCRPWNPNLVTARWTRHRKRFDLDHVRVHDLRHFVATELLTAGIDIRTVANRLGHARTSTTLDIYWAWVPAQDQLAAHHLETVLRPTGADARPTRPLQLCALWPGAISTVRNA